LGQVYNEYGDKYSGGLGTYTVKHVPMAIYASEADKTFFVYGGTPAPDKKYLVCMAGCYDHKTGMLQRPVTVHDKGIDGVLDPHDNPVIQIDKDGYLWIFVAGRGNTRPGIIYRSSNPYDITSFEYVSEDIMAYPQVFYDAEKGFFQFCSRDLAENPQKAEFALPTAVSRLMAEGKAKVKLLSSADRWYGVTYVADKPLVEDAIRRMTEAGLYPQGLWK
jgi:hypothetical protein